MSPTLAPMFVGARDRHSDSRPYDRDGLGSKARPIEFVVELENPPENETSGDRSELPEWVQIALKRLVAAASIPDRWAGPLSRSVDRQLFPLAFRIIAEVVPNDARYVPQIVPTVNGGLQLEWHRDGFDLEIEIAATGESYVDYSDAGGAEWEGEYLDLMYEVARILLEASERS